MLCLQFFLYTVMTNLDQEEQRFGKVSGDFVLQVKTQLLLCFCGGHNTGCDWMDHRHPRSDADNMSPKN